MARQMTPEERHAFLTRGTRSAPRAARARSAMTERVRSCLDREGVGWAAHALRRLEMPPDEVRAVLAADDAVLVHRYIELHGERLEERLADQRQTLMHLERLLTEAIRPAPEATSSGSTTSIWSSEHWGGS